MKNIIILFLYILLLSFSSKQTKHQEKTEIIEKILLENKVKKHFSNAKTKDNFRITITGTSILEGKMTFEIIDSKGKEILKEEYPSYYLIGFVLYDDEPKEKQELYIKKRVAEFFKNDNFFTPAIPTTEKYDEDYSDKKVWNTIKSDQTSVGFYYLIGEESGNRIAYSKNDNKVVIYFSCC